LFPCLFIFLDIWGDKVCHTWPRLQKRIHGILNLWCLIVKTAYVDCENNYRFVIVFTQLGHICHIKVYVFRFIFLWNKLLLLRYKFLNILWMWKMNLELWMFEIWGRYLNHKNKCDNNLDRYIDDRYR
jgi:hypothetical protein